MGLHKRASSRSGAEAVCKGPCEVPCTQLSGLGPGPSTIVGTILATAICLVTSRVALLLHDARCTMHNAPTAAAARSGMCNAATASGSCPPSSSCSSIRRRDPGAMSASMSLRGRVRTRRKAACRPFRRSRQTQHDRPITAVRPERHIAMLPRRTGRWCLSRQNLVSLVLEQGKTACGCRIYRINSFNYRRYSRRMRERLQVRSPARRTVRSRGDADRARSSRRAKRSPCRDEEFCLFSAPGASGRFCQHCANRPCDLMGRRRAAEVWGVKGRVIGCAHDRVHQRLGGVAFA